MISRQLARGDQVLKVDGRDVTRDPESLPSRLVGLCLSRSAILLRASHMFSPRRARKEGKVNGSSRCFACVGLLSTRIDDAASCSLFSTLSRSGRPGFACLLAGSIIV